MNRNLFDYQDVYRKLPFEVHQTHLRRQEILKIIKDVIKKTGANSPSDMGKVMGPVIKAVEGKADGKIIQSIVMKELNS